MICKDDISNIKTEIYENIGRKKFFEEEAVVENTYPNIFIVKNQGKETNASYRYTDILTNELQISIFDGKEYFPLVPEVSKTKF